MFDDVVVVPFLCGLLPVTSALPPSNAPFVVMARALKVPFGEIGDMSRKQASTLNLFRLSSTSTSLPTLTTNFEMAERFGVNLRSTVVKTAPAGGAKHHTFSGLPNHPSIRDDAFGRWEAIPLPDGLTLDQVLARVVSVNSFCANDRKNLILKVKVRFSDSSEITFARSDIHDPKTLAYEGYYSPNAAFDANTRPNAGATANCQQTGLKSAAAAFVKKGGAASLSASGKEVFLAFPKRDVIHALFHRLDVNGNGVLGLAELDKAVVELWPNFNNKPAIMRAYRAADSNGSGVLSKPEFGSFLRFLVNYNTLWAMFSTADRSRDRKLDASEFAVAMKALEPSKGEVEVRQLFQAIDVNKGGFVMFDEFVAMLSKERSNVIQPTNVKLSLPKLKSSQLNKAVTALINSPASSSPSRSFVVPPPEKVAELFDRIDVNGNGMLSLAELDKAVVELWPNFNNKPAIMRAYKAADANSTGFVSKSEFRYFLLYLCHFTNLWITFATIDSSGDRRVSQQEFLAAAPAFGVASDTDARQAFATMDRNQGGFVLFEEFAEYMAKTRAQHETRFDKRKRTVARKIASKAPLALNAHLQMPPNTTVEELFKRLDINGNGMLSLAELDKAVVELWPNLNNKPAVMRAYKAADVNKTGWISRSEFMFFLRAIVHYVNLFKAFSAVDASGDRRISIGEFLRGASAIGVRLPEGELKRLFTAIDKNGGGLILFDEFCAVLSQLAARQEA